MSIDWQARALAAEHAAAEALAELALERREYMTASKVLERGLAEARAEGDAFTEEIARVTHDAGFSETATPIERVSAVVRSLAETRAALAALTTVSEQRIAEAVGRAERAEAAQAWSENMQRKWCDKYDAERIRANVNAAERDAANARAEQAEADGAALVADVAALRELLDGMDLHEGKSLPWCHRCEDYHEPDLQTCPVTRALSAIHPGATLLARLREVERERDEARAKHGSTVATGQTSTTLGRCMRQNPATALGPWATTRPLSGEGVVDVDTGLLASLADVPDLSRWPSPAPDAALADAASQRARAERYRRRAFAMRRLVRDLYQDWREDMAKLRRTTDAGIAERDRYWREAEERAELLRARAERAERTAILDGAFLDQSRALRAALARHFVCNPDFAPAGSADLWAAWQAWEAAPWPVERGAPPHPRPARPGRAAPRGGGHQPRGDAGAD